ncbi:2OG-Fe(II) oxygenase [Roseomonas genomospecies 6]|nr:2OG-Fe(II) oxygenase [Roseomonas genomospecies 6]
MSMPPSMPPSMLDLDRFRATPLQNDPFDFLCVPGFVKRDHLEALHRDYPKVDKPGSIPLGVFPQGPAFDSLIAELRGEAVCRAFSEKFGLDLSRYPTMFTARGMCRATDGKIHPDSASKIVTVLIYMNPPWEASGGRLRVLRSPDLEDYAVEVPPDEGTLLCFRRCDTSWHGHHSFEGRRRAVQMNWVRNSVYIWHEQWRHRVGAWVKNRVGARPGRSLGGLG